MWIRLKKGSLGSSCCGSEVMNTTNTHEDVSSIPDLAQWVRAGGSPEQQSTLNPCKKNFHMPRAWPKKKQKKKKKKKGVLPWMLEKQEGSRAHSFY